MQTPKERHCRQAMSFLSDALQTPGDRSQPAKVQGTTSTQLVSAGVPRGSLQTGAQLGSVGATAALGEGQEGGSAGVEQGAHTVLTPWDRHKQPPWAEPVPCRLLQRETQALLYSQHLACRGRSVVAAGAGGTGLH